MNPFRWLVASWLAVFTVLAPVGRAQPNPPHVAYVYPAGGQQGGTFTVQVGGQYLDRATQVYVSGAGVQTTVVKTAKPMTQREVNQLRQKLQVLLKKEKDRATMEEIAAIRKKLMAFNRKANPALAETVTVQVTIAADAEPGVREVRLATPLGLSNPLVFRVGQLAEFCEPNAPSRGPGSGSTDVEMDITLPATVNGRIIPGDGGPARPPFRAGQPFLSGDVDRYRFEARRGQQLVIAARARELTPYLADAVPGWFQAVVTLYDADGKELAYDDDYRFHPDPVLHYVVPRDGWYTIEIRDAIYRGREDFVYRIDLGELPFVTSIFPLGGPAGTKTAVALAGWNLPIDTLTVDAAGKTPGVYPLSVRKGGFLSNEVSFAVDTLPECLEREPNKAPSRATMEPQDAQPVTLPVIVNGRIDPPGDWDTFRFEGRAGDQLVAEVYARRLDSPLDSVLELTDDTGRQLAFNDDHEDKGSGLNTHHADSLLMVTLPADGAYYLRLGDGQHKGGSEYAYRLRISAPRPDFDLRVVPSSINAGGGANVPLDVYALRKDGFSGDITLALKDAPKGFSLSGACVPAGQDHIRLTLAVSPASIGEPRTLSLEGRATIGGQEGDPKRDASRLGTQIVRPAVPADDMMQAFAYRHLVPAQDLKVVVTRRGGGRAAVRILGESPVKIPAGGTIVVPVAMPIPRALSNVHIELSEPPEGVTLQRVSLAPPGVRMVLTADANVKPGLRGNLILNVFGERRSAAGADKAKMARRRVPLGALPALPFEVVELRASPRAGS